MDAHKADDDAFSDLEPAVAEAARNAIFGTRLLCRMRGYPPLEVDSFKLKNILRRSYHYADIADPLLKVAKVSSNMIAGMVHEAPFNYLSRQAAMILADAYQRKSGFQLDMGDLMTLDEAIVSPLEDRNATESELQLAVEKFLKRHLKKL